MSRPYLTWDEYVDLIENVFCLSLGFEQGTNTFDDVCDESCQYRLNQFWDMFCNVYEGFRMILTQKDISYDEFYWFSNKITTYFDLPVIEQERLESIYDSYFDAREQCVSCQECDHCSNDCCDLHSICECSFFKYESSTC